MQGETVEWDLRSMWCHTSVMSQLLLLYLLVLLAVIIRTVGRTWRVVRPFRSPALDNMQDYRKTLNRSSRSLARWMQLSFLLWGMHTSGHIGSMLRGWILERSHVPTVWSCDFVDFSGTTGAVLAVVTIAFSVRWHLEMRSERLS